MNDPQNVGTESQLCRLLYRGSLSLPDSHIVLDGVTFIAKILPCSLSRLLDCPIALALESMRGRPCLRFISIVKTHGINHECSNDVYMYIHPRSIMTRRFFESILCTDQVNENNLAQYAVRLGLGNEYNADDTDILIFGRLSPSRSSLELSVGRIVTSEPGFILKRKPRPDDPVSRNPLAFALVKKPSLGKKRINQPGDETHLVKIDKIREKQKTVWGNQSYQDNRSRLKHKRPLPGACASVKDPCQGKDTVGETAGDIEINNKGLVKRVTTDKLLRCYATKDHPEFRDILNHTIHSIEFALRRTFKVTPVNLEDTERLVDLHVKMYSDGLKFSILGAINNS